MKKTRYWKLTISLALFLGLMVLATNVNFVEAKKDDSIITIDALVDTYSDLETLEKDTPVIVQAIFTGDRTSVPMDLKEGRLFRTESVVEIKKVIKGELEKKDKIVVYEPGILRDDNTYVNIAGYNLMNEKGKYTLFLTPVKNKEGYAIIGLYQGKYDNTIAGNGSKSKRISEKEDLIDVDLFGENEQHFNELKEQVMKKYKWE
ncbi:hypothetical protein EDM59_30725 [Brevibacillus nitrificans]|uniref:Uncharacterized protein n=1 Tax=Brevibacillus nitrificans TaxID=651560 RepID=A0A3M8CQN0_9BACL|nr:MULTISPECIES: hypothetical protein [Brevibacillus]MED1949758.1 hypothetical protein [Brevibacillus centrosporus]RNB77761.1 hypothetical protein EDM59_30725 [Brevibacillus nitrificans]